MENKKYQFVEKNADDLLIRFVHPDFSFPKLYLEILSMPQFRPLYTSIQRPDFLTDVALQNFEDMIEHSLSEYFVEMQDIEGRTNIIAELFDYRHYKFLKYVMNDDMLRTQIYHTDSHYYS